jgi:deoxyadenosine/deoxycytidine kinase
MDDLEELTAAYNRYFFHYNLSALLVVNTENVDFLKDERYVEALVREVSRVRSGVHHFVPQLS